MIKNCLAIHDLCTYSKSSLSVVIPVMEAMGVEVCPLVTALMSTQTDGFTDFYCSPCRNEMENIAKKLIDEKCRFDSIYCGYIPAEDADLVCDLISHLRDDDTLVVVDPVMGDGGSLYSGFDEGKVETMRRLVSIADIITPNLTEAYFLTGLEYRPYFDERLLKLLNKDRVVITSASDGAFNTTVCYDNGVMTTTRQASLDASYPGCGDMFASIFTSLMLRNTKMSVACNVASALCTLAIEKNLEEKVERRHGITPSLIMQELVRS